MLIWTDGACQRNPGPGGWAAIVCWEDGVVEEHSGGLALTTNNVMEMTAAHRRPAGIAVGLPRLRETDLRYLHDGMTSWMAGWKRKGWKTAAGDPVKNKELKARTSRRRPRRTIMCAGTGSRVIEDQASTSSRCRLVVAPAGGYLEGTASAQRVIDRHWCWY